MFSFEAALLVAFLLMAFDHDHADESSSAAEEQHKQHSRDANGVVVWQEELLDRVIRVNKWLEQSE